MSGIVRCYDKRQDCIARLNGELCRILNSTYPADMECPFYKNEY